MPELDPHRMINLPDAGQVPAWYLAGALRSVAQVIQQGADDEQAVRTFVALLAKGARP